MPSQSNDLLKSYLAGDVLYGDSSSPSEIAQWFEDEKEGYANLGAKDRTSYQYHYHALNQICGYAEIEKRYFENVLGVGSAYGDELIPILQKSKNIVILDPSKSFEQEEISGIPCRYVQPSVSGTLAFADESFDLITCFGVLHHIPNVSYVVKEMARCLKPGGIILLREPIVSMGNWLVPRIGLTRNERGIPVRLFDKIIESAGLVAHKRTLCAFPFLSKLCSIIGVAQFNSILLTRLDLMLSSLFKFNSSYHSESIFRLFRPPSVFYILEKK